MNHPEVSKQIEGLLFAGWLLTANGGLGSKPTNLGTGKGILFTKGEYWMTANNSPALDPTYQVLLNRVDSIGAVPAEGDCPTSSDPTATDRYLSPNG